MDFAELHADRTAFEAQLIAHRVDPGDKASPLALQLGILYRKLRDVIDAAARGDQPGDQAGAATQKRVPGEKAANHLQAISRDAGIRRSSQFRPPEASVHLLPVLQTFLGDVEPQVLDDSSGHNYAKIKDQSERLPRARRIRSTDAFRPNR